LRSSEEGGDGITTSRPGDRRVRVVRRATTFLAAFVRPAARRFAPDWAFEARLLGFAAFFAVRVRADDGRRDEREVRFRAPDGVRLD